MRKTKATGRKRTGKRLAAMVMALVLSVFALPVAAGAASATFTNKPDPEPDLYITKTVVNAVDGYEADPDTEFTFILKWDLDGDGTLSFAKEETYTVYTEDGTQVLNYDESTGLEIPFKTSSTGRFTLKAGQTAKFEYVGTDVAYEVTEVETEYFVQTLPAGSTSATGTVDEYGTIVYFENTYIPDIPTPEDTYTTLQVRKDTLTANGKETTGQEFTFMVYVANEAFANQAYTVYDTSTGQEAGSGETDENGCFTITGGQYAEFTSVPCDEDYSISEEVPDGWTNIQSSGSVGGTTYPLTYAYFTNQENGGTVELTKLAAEDDTVLPENAVFGIYSDEGCEELVERITTDENGYAASSLLDHGTYYIKEIVPPLGYGLNGDVYTVTIDGTEEVVSLGEIEDPQVDGSITLIKKSDGGDLLQGVEFTLYTSDGEKVGGAETDENGVAEFSGLRPGDYYFVETKGASGYTLLEGPVSVTIPFTATEEEAEGQDMNTAGVSCYDGTYYFYDLTYEVTNNAVFTMPATGGNHNLLWIAIAGLAAVAAGLFIGIKKNKGKGGNIHAEAYNL